MKKYRSKETVEAVEWVDDQNEQDKIIDWLAENSDSGIVVHYEETHPTIDIIKDKKRYKGWTGCFLVIKDRVAYVYKPEVFREMFEEIKDEENI